MINALEMFVYGFALGYFCNPVWRIIKKIIHEARLAKKEW